MTLHFTIHPRLQLSRMLLALALAMASGVHAQTDRSVAAVQAPPPAEEHVPPQPLRVRSIDIGSAAQKLWDLQRAAPGVRPRPIDGDQASRSYQRYLKSFEYPIPERFSSGLEIVKK
ncbi:MAG: DUF3613 domain-containing protein [Comamonas sp.]|uniref:DUF3613 domain-containing protein n=1 Tax=Comamonas sp. TaxID=34028 RepID=UPI002FCBFDD2